VRQMSLGRKLTVALALGVLLFPVLSAKQGIRESNTRVLYSHSENISDPSTITALYIYLPTPNKLKAISSFKSLSSLTLLRSSMLTNEELLAAKLPSSLTTLSIEGGDDINASTLVSLVGGTPALTSLYVEMGGGTIAESELRTLLKTPSLVSLSLFGCAWKDDVSTAPSSAYGVRHLELGNLVSGGPSWDTIRRLDHIEFLSVHPVFVPVDLRLDPLPKLRELRLGGFSLQSKGVGLLLAATPALESLSLTGAPSIDKGILEALAAGADTIRSLDISYCSHLAAVLPEILTRLPLLDKLNVDGLFGERDAILPVEALMGTQWIELSLANAAVLDDVAASRLFADQKLLSRLDISGTSIVNFFAKLDDKALPNLSTLSVSGCELSEEAIRALGRASIKELNISHIQRVHGNPLRHLLSSCPHVEHLELFGCNNLNDADAAEIAKLAELQQVDLGYTGSNDSPMSMSGLRKIIAMPSLLKMRTTGRLGGQEALDDLHSACTSVLIEP
jgi:hypothetical protein